MSTVQKSNKEIEYQECLNDMRNLRNNRFALFSLYSGVMGALFWSFCNTAVLYIIQIWGIVLTGFFFLLHERIIMLFDNAHIRALELEESLFYKYITNRGRKSKFISMRMLTRIVFVLIAIFWFILFIKPSILRNQ